MEKNLSENPSHDFLKDQLLKAEEEYINLKKTLRIEKKRMERLTSQQQTSKQQIEFYTQEYQIALESIKQCTGKITKEICEDLLLLKNPTQVIQEISLKTMLVLGESTGTYEEFLVLLENYSKFKEMLNNSANNTLADTVVNEILPVWKNQAFYQAKLAKSSKCAALLAQWLGFTVEYTLKKSTVLMSKRKDPDTQKKIKIQLDIIKDLTRELHMLKENINMAHKALKDFEELEQKKSVKGDLDKKISASHRRAASQIFQSLQNFPNFNDDKLYEEMPEQSLLEGKIKMEGNEAIGCCRLRFFCF